MFRFQLLCILFFPVFVFAQSDLKIGDWKAHLPYQIAKQVTQSDEKVYYATDEAIFIIDKEDDSVSFLNTVDGLSDTGVREILFDQDNNQLIVAYNSSVIDIVRDDEIISITDIRDKTTIQGDRQIYDIHIQNGKQLFIATGFGLVEYDLQKLEFGFTLDISEQVSAISGDGSRLIMALESGAYTLDLSMTNAPGFINEWSLATKGIANGYVPSDVHVQNQKMYISTVDTVYMSNDGMNYSALFGNEFPDFDNIFIKQTPDGWMLGSFNDPANKSKIFFFDNDDNYYKLVDNCTSRLVDAELTPEGRLYLGDQWRMIRYKESLDGPCGEYVINSPFGIEASDIQIVGNALYAASGGITDSYGDLFGRKGVNIYKDRTWRTINTALTPFMNDNDVIQTYVLTANSTGDRIYFGSFWAGVVEYIPSSESFELFNENNSSLRFLVGDRRVRISGLAMDRDDNLWVSNYGAAEPVSVKTPEGDWVSFALEGVSDTKVAALTVDDNNYVWVTIGGSSGGVVVIDRGDSLEDKRDDRQRYMNLNNSEIPSSLINAVKVDNDGAVWIGTGVGAVVFECGSSVFDTESCAGNLRKVSQDSILALLLETENVLSIAVDGANRKWFGTQNGIFVQSPDGKTQIAEYNVDNSPLFDNTIRDMDFDASTGEMFIATNKGIQTIKTETTGATNRHTNQVYAYPNPVRPEYTGPIAIKGLPQDADVRITDMNGKLVYKTEALGGQAIWNGITLEGRQAAGGVYLVFSSSTDTFGDIDSYVTKIFVAK